MCKDSGDEGECRGSSDSTACGGLSLQGCDESAGGGAGFIETATAAAAAAGASGSASMRASLLTETDWPTNVKLIFLDTYHSQLETLTTNGYHLSTDELDYFTGTKPPLRINFISSAGGRML
jgi:hypothetical protein